MPSHLAYLAGILTMFSTECWAQRSGPVVVGQTFLASTIDPGCDCSAPWALTSHGISEKLFTVDADGNIVGQVAQSVAKISDLVWEVTLKSGYKFSDGTSVSAELVAAGLTELNTANSAARTSGRRRSKKYLKSGFIPDCFSLCMKSPSLMYRIAGH